MTVVSTPLAGLHLVWRMRIGDERGFLARIFCADELRNAGWVKPIAQVNHTFTARRGTVRGLHFQHPPHSEMKLVTCLRGEAWDVAVDLRQGSSTFLQWHSAELSAENGHALLIPDGFAHGFQALTDDVEMLYCHSCAYTSGAESGLNPRDAMLAIDWPLAISDISQRDAEHAAIDGDFKGVRV